MQECGKEQAKVAEDRKRYREFTVTPGLVGFKVKIGCAELYFSTAERISEAITNYLLDPQKTERQFQNGDIRLGSPIGTMAPEPMIPSNIRPNRLEER